MRVKFVVVRIFKSEIEIKSKIRVRTIISERKFQIKEFI
jgi:hypothetical protein